jgi:hypothetical protein
MSESKFTPGPWKVHHYGAADEWVRTADGEAIVCVGHNRGKREANARLIAAAPELFRVASLLADDPPACASQRTKPAGHGDCDCWACCLVSEARAALAKAVAP